jgi:methylenetetrahydrofolate dehydrogenase (NADP+) / methenyltetrahydrofolate cyclohydrolase
VATVVDGRVLQRRLVDAAAARLRGTGVIPSIALVMVDMGVPLLASNLDLHTRFLRRQGCEVVEHRLPPAATQRELLALVERLNADPAVHGVMVLIPTPPQIDMAEVIGAIDPTKELEGLHPDHLAAGLPTSARLPTRTMLVPTVLRTVFADVGLELAGAHVVVVFSAQAMRRLVVADAVGRYGVASVWPPEAVVTTVPSDSPRLRELVGEADVLVLSVERAGIVPTGWLRPGAAVFDFNGVPVGSRPSRTRPDQQVLDLRGGLADPVAAAEVASVVCPVPGGFGPVMLGELHVRLVDAALALTADRRSRSTAEVVG